MTDEALLHARITIPEHVVLRRFAEDSVALNLSSGEYHGLNPTAAAMLSQLTEGGSPEDVARRVSEDANVGLETVTADLLELLRALAERGLIEIHDAG